MEKFEITVLGCGAAIPPGRHMTTSQLLNIHDTQFLIDCGEGTQTQIWKMGLRITNLRHILISHGHGDHFFGLVPLLSSMGLMLGRTEEVHLYIPERMEYLLKAVLEAYCRPPFPIVIHTHGNNGCVTLYEDDEMSVETIPLKHSTSCNGFLFKEKPKGRVLNVEECSQRGISVREFQRIKDGEDYVALDGTVIPNSELTQESPFVPRSYAFCSDTAYCPDIVPLIKGVDLLYHETTYLAADEQQAVESDHSTTLQAAAIARDANVGKLLLGHYSLRYDDDERFEMEAKTIFPNSEAVNEGMVINVEHLTEEEKAANLLVKTIMPDVSVEVQSKPQIEVLDGLHIDWEKSELVASDADIEEAYIPQGITSVKALAFKKCKNLRSVVIPESVNFIGKSAFQGCTSLSSVCLRATVSELRDTTFKDCTSLTEIAIPEGVSYIGKGCFRGCRLLHAVSLPSTLKTIDTAAFQDCESLEVIAMPQGLETIKFNAFKGCSFRNGIMIPEGCFSFEGNIG